jgi:hypothetical protein
VTSSKGLKNYRKASGTSPKGRKNYRKASGTSPKGRKNYRNASGTSPKGRKNYRKARILRKSFLGKVFSGKLKPHKDHFLPRKYSRSVSQILLSLRSAIFIFSLGGDGSLCLLALNIRQHKRIKPFL